MPDGWEGRLNLVKLVGGAIAAVVATGTAYVTLGGPVPATRGWTQKYHAELAAREEIRGLITALDKGIAELEPGDTRDALEAQRDALRARLDDQG
jgi:hypothetical protein